MCLFNNLPALNLLSLPPLQGASRKASAVLFFLCFILEPSFLYSSFVSLDQCSTKDWSQVGLKYCEPVRPPLSADKSVSELGSAPQCTGLFFFSSLRRLLFSIKPLHLHRTCGQVPLASIVWVT